MGCGSRCLDKGYVGDVALIIPEGSVNASRLEPVGIIYADSDTWGALTEKGEPTCIGQTFLYGEKSGACAIRVI